MFGHPRRTRCSRTIAVLFGLWLLACLPGLAAWGQDDWGDIAVAADEAGTVPAVAAQAAAAETAPALTATAEETAMEDVGASFAGVEVQPEELSAFEAIRRRERELLAESVRDKANQAFVAGKYDEATNLYKEAKKYYLQAGRPDAQERAGRMDESIAKVNAEWADSIANEAAQLANAGQFEDAIAKAQEAARFSPKDARLMDERIKRYRAMQEKAIIQRQVATERIDPDGADRQQQVTIYIERGKRLYERQRFMAAKAEYEQALLLDPYNMDATTGLYNINKKLKAFGERRRVVTELERMAENAWKWSEPITPIGGIGTARIDSDAVDKRITTSRIERKLETIIIPRIDFEEATIHQVIRFLRDKSRELDPDDGKGVSIVFQSASGIQADGGTPAPAAAPLRDTGFDFGDDWGAPAPAAGAPLGGLPDAGGAVAGTGTVTIAATDIPLKEAIRFVCNSAGLKYKVTEYAVIIGDKDAAFETLEVKIFDVPPGMFAIVGTRQADAIVASGWAAGATTPADDDLAGTDMRAFLTQLGIEFPTNAAAKLISNRTKLWAKNTPDNLNLIEQFLKASEIKEHQVTIEAKFVEISQNDLEALGFEWLIGNGDGLSVNPMTGDYQWSNGGKFSIGNPNKFAVLKQDANSQWPFNTALTGALRYANFDPTFFSGNSGVLGIQSIIGSMEFNTVIHALNRADSTDVLSSPKVTAKSDETAILRMVTERYFPEGWTEPEIESGGTDSNSTFKPSVPEFGAARDIGVVLEATPKVDPKKEYLIDLLLRPQVYNFLGYDTDLNYKMIVNGQEVEGKAQMPIIAARTVETSVMVWDGETVVLGGMISEHLVEFNDKVPVLGDIPILGRLFQSRGKKSEKRNLLIFVTARLVDPAGRPKRATHEMRGIPDFGR